MKTNSLLIICPFCMLLFVGCTNRGHHSTFTTPDMALARIRCKTATTARIISMDYRGQMIPGEKIESFWEANGPLSSNALLIIEWHDHVPRDARMAGGNQTLIRIIDACNRSRSQVCHLQKEDGGSIAKGRDAIVHWKSPFYNPRDGAETEYFINGRSCGKGDNGLRAVRSFCKTNTVSRVLFARSRFTAGGSWDGEEFPFDARVLKDIEGDLRSRGIKSLRLLCHEFWGDIDVSTRDISD